MRLIKCDKCEHIVDIDQVEIFEMANGQIICEGCWFFPEEKEKEEALCDCTHGCANCLDLEPRSFR